MTTEMIIEQELRDEVETLRALNAQLRDEVEKLREKNGELRWHLTRFEVALEQAVKYLQLPKELYELRDVRQGVEGADGVDPIRSAL